MTATQCMHWARGLMRFLTVPMSRAQGLRQDDRAQVMVLSAVMVFVVMIFSMATLNTSELLHNRIQNQTAVDAAADAYALWQARGLNLVQHTNDYHTEQDTIFLAETLLLCVARLICTGDWCGGPSRRGGYCKNDVRSCCRNINDQLTQIERQQGLTAFVIHTLQKTMIELAPRLGWITANDVAQAAGADAIIPNGLDGVINAKMQQLGVVPTYDASFVATLYPGNSDEVHVVPNRIPRIDVIPMTFPPYFNPGRCLGVQELCDLSTCDGGSMPACLLTLFTGGNLVGCMSGGSPNACNYTCVRAPGDSDLGPQACGWSDWFFLGGPTAYTWIAAKTDNNLVDYIENIRWLNPRSGSDTEPLGVGFPDVELSEYDQFAFYKAATGPAAPSNFVNSAFVTMATSHSLGANPGEPQPATIHSAPGFGYARPQIVNVHLDPLGLSDQLAEEKIIWH